MLDKIDHPVSIAKDEKKRLVKKVANTFFGLRSNCKKSYIRITK